MDDTMNFGDLQPGDFFTFKPLIGMPWSDRRLYRKATVRTYHCADKVLTIRTIGSTMTLVTPESSDTMATIPSGSWQEGRLALG
jgi:hypothetical protein